jgi:hypothetical protein
VAKDLRDPAKLAHNRGGFPYGGAQGALDRVGTPNTYTPAAPERYSEDLFTVNSFKINKGIHPNTKLVTKMTAVDKVLQRSICVTTSSTNKKGGLHSAAKFLRDISNWYFICFGWLFIYQDNQSIQSS